MSQLDKEEGLNILLIKRNENCKIAEFLRQSGHHVVECTNEKEALEFFQTGDFHLLLDGKTLSELALRRFKLIRE